MHFEPMVSAVPLLLPTISYLGPVESQVIHMNDLSDAEAVRGRAKKVEGTDFSMWADADQKDVIHNKKALNWMCSSMEEQAGLPFGVALVIGAFGVPMILPNVGIGAAVIAGYAAGAITYYLEFRGKPEIKNETK